MQLVKEIFSLKGIKRNGTNSQTYITFKVNNDDKLEY